MLETMIKLKLVKRCDEGDLTKTSNVEINTHYNEYVQHFEQ